ncbi:MAG TPA: glycerol-3-phosphate dehydrogenase/oxidase [Fimbriimonas sp.]
MSPLERGELLDRLRTEGEWEVLVVGGGATGLGTAVDAASRGYRTLLLEAHDFAKGTSSRSTKLVHGGVRYLAQGNLSLVREALRERGILRRNAPHLTHDLPFVIPAYRWWDRAFYGIGLSLYDALAGDLGLGPTRILSREAVLRQIPTVRSEGLRGGIVYHDAQFDDARMAIALMLTLVDLGGAALNYLPVTGFLRQGGNLAGVRAADSETGETFEIRAKAVVNATGVFSDEVRRLDDPASETMLSPSQGIHLVLDRSFLPGDYALMIPRTDDGRVLFAIPWYGRVVVGTTDTSVPRASIEPRAMESEIEFLLLHSARYLETAPRREDVLAVFAGLRPLVKGVQGQTVASLSRDHSLTVSPSGLVTITGGKWTTYRRMAAQAVDRAAEVGGFSKRACQTESLRLHGWREGTEGGPLEPYGSDSSELESLIAAHPGWEKPLHPDLPFRAGEVRWAARYELARTVEDVLSRRTRALVLDARASLEAAPAVAEILGDELGRDRAWKEDQLRGYREIASGMLAVVAPGEGTSSHAGTPKSTAC